MGKGTSSDPRTAGRPSGGDWRTGNGRMVWRLYELSHAHTHSLQRHLLVQTVVSEKGPPLGLLGAVVPELRRKGGGQVSDQRRSTPLERRSDGL